MAVRRGGAGRGTVWGQSEGGWQEGLLCTVKGEKGGGMGG
jgi:hypothetical protein